ncbi:MAG TPA: hypothetical protein VLT87_29230 [Thermoanaerobaculia bacterium]|nr:hypothetical protein [Thermoanaerobaculia bacterium]
MEHPSEETLKRFAAGTASRDESRTVVAHLVKGCRFCAAALRSLLKPAETPEKTYGDVLDRFGERLSEVVAEAERRPAPRPRLLERVLLKPAGKERPGT